MLYMWIMYCAIHMRAERGELFSRLFSELCECKGEEEEEGNASCKRVSVFTR